MAICPSQAPDVHCKGPIYSPFVTGSYPPMTELGNADRYKVSLAELDKGLGAFKSLQGLLISREDHAEWCARNMNTELQEI